MGRRRAENAAHRLLQQMGVGADPPVDVRWIAKTLGISIVERPQLSKAGYGTISGLLLRREGSTICIINRDHAPTRRRYSIAHEIGHFMLHPPEEAYIDVAARSDKSSDGTDPREIEANAFAAVLLMPEQPLRQRVPGPLDISFEDDAERVSQLAKEFNVSTTAMTYRLLNLGLLVDKPAGIGGL
jgi:Zn-dependent peptidase ImmA (M78 family)